MEYELFLEQHYTDKRVRDLIILRTILKNKIGYFVDGDGHAISEYRFCVVDGVTRDLLNDNEFKLTMNPYRLIETGIFYPSIKKLREGSFLCANHFINSSSEDVKQIMSELNSIVTSRNNFQCNYLGRDYFAYTVAGGIIKSDHIDMTNIGDSNVFLFDDNFDLVFSTYDTYTERDSARRNYAKDHPEVDIFGRGWGVNKVRAAWRRELRDTHVSVSNPVSFGALTGEDKAMDYVYSYSHSLRDAAYIVACTDGYLDIVKIREELIKLITGQDIRPEKEGTIVAYQRCKHL